MDLTQRASPFLRQLWMVASALTVALASVSSLRSAPVPLYENNGPIVAPPAIAPQIDAITWVNRSVFDIFSTTGLPYESEHTLFFTNTPSGRMTFDPGVRFFQNAGGKKLAMNTWVNEGTIATDHDSFLLGLFFLDSRASILQVLATNIISKGNLFSGAAGLVRLEGTNISVPRIGIRTGVDPAVSAGFFGTTFIGVSNYINDVGVTDVYWGGGTNNSTRANQPAMPLNPFGGIPNFSLPLPSSPFHDVIYRSILGTLFTNNIRIPGGLFFIGTNFIGNTLFNRGFNAAVYTNTLSATSSVVQIVFYPTNNDALSTTEVRFSPGFGASDVIVGFHSVDFDIATQSGTTNSVYLVDTLASSTNVFFARNLQSNTRRPSTYEVTRTLPFGFSFGSPPNATLTSNLVSGPQYLRNSVTNLYAAYAAQIANLGSSPSGSIPYDVTNVPGRVDILGNNVDLNGTRIRAESAVVIKANNLISNRLAIVDAPLVNFDVGSVEPTLTITNLAPITVRRFSGALQAWSGRWENEQAVIGPAGPTTNTVLFHVLIVDSGLQADVPVTVNEFAVRGANHVIGDLLRIGKSFKVVGDSVTFVNGLTTPLGYSLGASNLVGIRNFTNDGVILLGGLENFGMDREDPYLSFVNRGTNSAYTIFLRSDVVNNSGCMVSSGGPMNIETPTLTLAGRPYVATNMVFTNFFFDPFFRLVTNVFTNTTVLVSPAKLDSVSELRLTVDSLATSNAWINAGTLVIDAAESIVDSGPSALSFWNVTNGLQVLNNPPVSSLLGTYVRSTAGRFTVAEHIWAGTDVGASTAGFTDNLALGKLTLDGGAGSTFIFRPSNGVKALYVDYLELVNAATNYNDPSTIAIDSQMTIYFANANLSAEKLNGALNGRLQWVPDFAGPLSSTNIFYASTGKTYTFNIALVTSKDLDSDGDGISNANDPEPIYVPESAVLAVELAGTPRRAILSWTALAYSTNYVEVKTSPNQSNWDVLTNFVHGPFTMPVNLTDPVPANGPSRIYRLKVQPLRP
jgi:hypothetical protein